MGSSVVAEVSFVTGTVVADRNFAIGFGWRDTVYTMRDLRTKAGRLNNSRTTKLINIKTGATMIEVIGYATKGECHIAFLNEGTKRAAEMLKG